jgi:hypothetical protein
MSSTKNRRAGEKWEPWEEKKILVMLLTNADVNDIAEELGRTPNAVNCRLEVMATEQARFRQLKRAILADPPVQIYSGDE